jgi:hypothetical protein
LHKTTFLLCSGEFPTARKRILQLFLGPAVALGNLIPKAAFALMPFTLVFQYRVKA